METRYFKSLRSGYQAESMTETDTNGQAWQISTMKDSRGFVACSAIQGDVNERGIFSYMMFGAKRLELAKEQTKCTETSVKRVHEAGLLAFAQDQPVQPETTAPAYVVGIGQILFTDGFDEKGRRAIYEIKSPGHFKTVLLDGSDLRHDDHVRPYSEKFGIGTYYNEGEKISLEEVNNLVNQARQAIEDRNQAEQKASDKAAQERARKIEEGKQILTAISERVKAVIVAEELTTTYDPYADYQSFSDHTERVIYLAFSDHTKDLFSEMRKAADKYEPVQHLGTGKNIFTAYQVNTSDTDFQLKGQHQHKGCSLKNVDESPVFYTRPEVEKWVSGQPEPLPMIADDGREINFVWHIDEQSLENRQKYSMGSGYFLRQGYSGGWRVRKYNVPSLETMQIAAAEGRFLCNTKEQPTTTKEEPTYEAQEVKAGTVQIIDYSEKAIAVIGDTKPLREKLKSLGGKFNFRLSCGPAWIFSKTRLEAVTKALQSPVIPDAEIVEVEADEQETKEKAEDTNRPSKTLEEAKERLNNELKKTAEFLGIDYPRKQTEAKGYEIRAKIVNEWKRKELLEHSKKCQQHLTTQDK